MKTFLDWSAYDAYSGISSLGGDYAKGPIVADGASGRHRIEPARALM